MSWQPEDAVERSIDSALESTFPASDPFSIPPAHLAADAIEEPTAP